MKTKIGFLLIFTFSLIYMGCGPKQFYEMTENGLEYYFFKKNKEAKRGEIGDIYTLNVTATTRKDSTLFSQRVMFERSESIYPGDFHDGLSMVHEKDSVAFILHKDSFFVMHGINIPKGLENDSMFKLLIGVEQILSPFEHLVYKCEEELVKMKDYANRKGWECVTDSTGIMYEIIEPMPESTNLEVGDSAFLTYTYSTLNDQVLEKRRDGDSWKFQVGGPQTRVSGLTRLLVLMKDGEKARALIPFAEAFGEDGLAPLIAPYTTLVLEIKAEKVK